MFVLLYIGKTWKKNELLHSENLTKLYCLSLKFKIEVILDTFTPDFYLLYCNNKLLYQTSSNLVFIILYRNSNVIFIRKTFVLKYLFITVIPNHKKTNKNALIFCNCYKTNYSEITFALCHIGRKKNKNVFFSLFSIVI